MKRPKDRLLSKQEYSALVFIVCVIFGCACMLFVVWSQPNYGEVERLLSSVFLGGIGVFFAAMLLWYVAYLRAKRKYGMDINKELSFGKDGEDEQNVDEKEATQSNDEEKLNK